MHLEHLSLRDFRSYREVDVDFGESRTVIVGRNGSGKTNLLEAVHYLAAGRSLRGVPAEALVRAGATSAVVRGEGRRGGRQVLVEAEIRPGGRGRIQVNKQRVRRARDLAEAFQTTVFLPDDMVLVKGGPSGRREYLDDLVRRRDPILGGAQEDLERVLKQRNALLKQAGGRRTDDVVSTLAVWDEKLVTAGEAVTTARLALLDELRPRLTEAYDHIADEPVPVDASYASDWRDEGLAAALDRVADQELRRGITLVGPHRDEVVLTIGGLPSRTHASQGEQRTLALALRLAGHRLLADHLGTPPLLLLDDIFSELDPVRCAALLAHLPAGQTLLTTASPLPPGLAVDHRLEVRDGTVGVATP